MESNILPDQMPLCPEPLEYLYKIFQRLSGRRQVGMDINKISHEAIFFFSNLNKMEFHNWEIEALENIDDAVIAIYRAKSSKEEENKTLNPTSRGDSKYIVDETKQIPISDVAGVRSLMQRLKAGHETKHEVI